MAKLQMSTTHKYTNNFLKIIKSKNNVRFKEEFKTVIDGTRKLCLLKYCQLYRHTRRNFDKKNYQYPQYKLPLFSTFLLLKNTKKNYCF